MQAQPQRPIADWATQARFNNNKLPFEDLLRELKLVTYPTHAISPASSLQQKIDCFKSPEVRDRLSADLGGLNSYRKVRGDGNCFYRALAFEYISHVNSTKIDDCFQMLHEVNLACCSPKSIPKDFARFYDSSFLREVLAQEWEASYEKCLQESQHIRKKALLKLIDENPYLDFIMVLYCRSVCLKALASHRDQLRDYLTGTQDASITTYSEQTEGLAINLCAKIFGVDVVVYQVREKKANKYEYSSSRLGGGNKWKIHLLYYENHYDIIEYNEHIEAERSTINPKDCYYAEVREQLVHGICFECHRNDYIYEVSGLCSRCHESSLSDLHNFAQERLIKAQCSQCLHTKQDVSSIFGLCKECMKVQSSVEKRKLEEVESIRLGKQICIACDQYQFLSPESGLCDTCSLKQREYLLARQEQDRNFPRPGFKHQDRTQLKQTETGQLACKLCKMMDGIFDENKICHRCNKAGPNFGQVHSDGLALVKPHLYQTKSDPGPAITSPPSQQMPKICRKCPRKLEGPLAAQECCPECREEPKVRDCWVCRVCQNIYVTRQTGNCICSKCSKK